MRILIIGGTRFIGPAVVARLSAMGHQVIVFHRGESEAELPPGVRHLHGDRQRLGEFMEEFRRLAPDVVLDMVPFTQRDAQVVVATFLGVARRLVALSSQDVYRAYGRFHGTEPGPPEPVPLAEDAPLRGRLYPYRGSGRGLDDYEKILVERAAIGDGLLPGTVLRLPMVYGERDYQRRLSLELKRMDDGRPAILLEERFARWRWTRGYVENAAAAIALAVSDERATGRVYNVGEAEALSYADWVRAIGQVAGWTGEVRVVSDGRLPPQLRPPAGDYQQHLVADTSRIRQELGYIEPVPRYEALRRTIEWERAHRPDWNPRLFDYAAEDAVLAELARGVH
ncbi:MAG: NAD-dependent dehydratase [Chloroflexi bacterium RBG_16_68_14]|nr:MAG: NAD-dependent dehydratase [Chloroflexi bacterium RBG_16_68_14]